MKDIYELAFSTITAVSALTPKVISATIEEIRRGKRVIAQFYRINSDLKANGGTQVEFPKKNMGIVVNTNMASGDTISASSITYDATTLTIQKHGIGLGIPGEAIRQIKRDLIKDEIIEAGECYADAMETLAVGAMFPDTTISLAGAGPATFTGSGTYIVGIISTVGAVTSMINIASGYSVVISAATIHCWMARTSSGYATVSATAGSFCVKDIFAAKTGIGSYNYEPDVVVVNTRRYGEILYDPATNFVQRSAYTGQGIPMNGEIGKLWDLKMIVTNRSPIYGIAVVDTSALGYCIERLDLDLKKDDITGLSTDKLYFYGFAERNYGVVNARSYGAVAWQGTLTELQPTS